MKKLKVVLPIVLVVLFVAASGAAAYTYKLYQDSQTQVERLKKPTEAARLETQQTVESVGKLIALPSSETPTIATVTDAKKLKNQPFFARASNGDKVLIYTNAKKAILYNPASNKIIEVAPVNIDTKGSVAGATAAPVKAVRIAIYNGTTQTGLTNTLEAQLKEQVKNVEIVRKANAIKDDYSKTLVVDLTGGDQKDAAGQLAKLLNGEVGNLPDGESKPNADILVIAGK